MCEDTKNARVFEYAVDAVVDCMTSDTEAVKGYLFAIKELNTEKKEIDSSIGYSQERVDQLRREQRPAYPNPEQAEGIRFAVKGILEYPQMRGKQNVNDFVRYSPHARCISVYTRSPGSLLDGYPLWEFSEEEVLSLKNLVEGEGVYVSRTTTHRSGVSFWVKSLEEAKSYRDKLRKELEAQLAALKDES